MKKNNLSEKSSEDLVKTKQILSVITGMLAGALILIIVIALFQSNIKIMLPLMIIPLALSPIVIVNFIQIKSIAKELKSRNLN